MHEMSKRSRRKHHKQSSADPVPMTIDVVLKCDDPLSFYLASTSPGVVITPVQLGGKATQMVTFDNANGGAPSGYMITFTLSDQTNKGYQFKFDDSDPDPKDAIWVKKVSGTDYCPGKKQLTGPFQPQSVDANSLVVKNPNGKLEYFGFALVVALADGSNPLVLDPVGNNMNGSGRSWN